MKNKKEKQAVRARMEATGEKYTEARRALSGSSDPLWKSDPELVKIRESLVRFGILPEEPRTDPVLQKREEELLYVERYLRTRYFPALGLGRALSNVKVPAISKLQDWIDQRPHVGNFVIGVYLNDPSHPDPDFPSEKDWPSENALWHLERLFREEWESNRKNPSLSQTYRVDEVLQGRLDRLVHTAALGSGGPPVQGGGNKSPMHWPEIDQAREERVEELMQGRSATPSTNCPHCGYHVPVDDPTVCGEEVVCPLCKEPSTFEMDVFGSYWLEGIKE